MHVLDSDLKPTAESSSGLLKLFLVGLIIQLLLTCGLWLHLCWDGQEAALFHVDLSFSSCFIFSGTPIEQQWPQNLALAVPSLASNSSFFIS
ncbi:hypothetical protein F2Q68_00041501 [Brassica cretica]|uniref:Uncharacterized protein n=1 Tax=Brassica cretica TaxID=69181 RepID=A0A8S9MMH1_BRACR|nr:hypothetical protein F2Q68_00041501 [Brassica cretica]